MPELHWIYITGARKTAIDDIGVRRIVAKAFERTHAPDAPIAAPPTKKSTQIQEQPGEMDVQVAAEVRPSVIVKSMNDARSIAPSVTIVVRSLEETNSIH